MPDANSMVLELYDIPIALASSLGPSEAFYLDNYPPDHLPL